MLSKLFKSPKERVEAVRPKRIFRVDSVEYTIHSTAGEIDCEFEHISWSKEYEPNEHWILEMLMNLKFHISGKSIFKQENIRKITLKNINLSRVEEY
jgi:hypothetical protein